RATRAARRTAADPSSAARPAKHAAARDARPHHPTGPSRQHHPFRMSFRPAGSPIPGDAAGPGPRGDWSGQQRGGRGGGGGGDGARAWGGLGGGGGGGGGRGLRPFARRLLGRVAVARRTLAVCVAAGLGGGRLLLGQMTLLGGGDGG